MPRPFRAVPIIASSKVHGPVHGGAHGCVHGCDRGSAGLGNFPAQVPPHGRSHLAKVEAAATEVGELGHARFGGHVTCAHDAKSEEPTPDLVGLEGDCALEALRDGDDDDLARDGALDHLDERPCHSDR